MPVASITEPGLAAFLVWSESLSSCFGWEGVAEVLNGSNLSAVSAYEADSADDEGRAGSSNPLKAVVSGKK